MASQNVTKHYNSACDMPNCICPNASVFLWMQRQLLTTNGFPYFMGTVTTVTEVPSGGFDVVINYDDALLPNDPSTGQKLVPDFPSSASAGTVCDPDCNTDCSWVTRMLQVLHAGSSGGVISRSYLVFGQNQDVANGAFDIPRIPFLTGYRLTDVRITCFGYDTNTSAAFLLKVGAVVYASYTGNLSGQKQLAIAHPVIAYDEMPLLQISGLVNGVYGQSAKGLVLELIGIINPP
jgi:hypothetical protein